MTLMENPVLMIPTFTYFTKVGKIHQKQIFFNSFSIKLLSIDYQRVIKHKIKLLTVHSQMLKHCKVSVAVQYPIRPRKY